MDNMPIGLKNAYLSDELTMRVGLPSSGGKLNFHAFDNDYKVMVSASAFWNPAKGVFRIPEATDLSETDFALDSAGFTAMLNWKSKGVQQGMAGIFPWSYADYISLVSDIRPSWWSQPDLCCEQELAGNQNEVDFRVNATATLLEGTLQVLYAWHNELARSSPALSDIAIANMLPPPVPIIQGWLKSDYIRSLDLLQAVWERWTPWLAPPSLIGIGSVCRRDLMHPEHGLYSILDGLEGKLPAESRLHCFGVKGNCLDKLKMMKMIASCDSMAWDYTSRIEAYRSKISNTIAHRAVHMDHWMDSAIRRMRPAQGDQFRLSF